MRGFGLNILLLLGASLTLPGCVGELSLDNPDGTGIVAGGPDGGGGSSAQIAFTNDVAPALVNRSCNACHSTAGCQGSGGGHCFLGNSPDEFYAALTGSTYLGATPATSLFLNVGRHNGAASPGFCSGPQLDSDNVADATCTGDQVTAISAWITLQANGGL